MSRLALASGVVLLAAEVGVAVWLTATSGHEVDPWPTVIAWMAAATMFVLAGLVALWRRPANRTGVYLASTGYLWFLGALTAADDPWIYTIGGIVGDAALITFAALVLVFPSGRFETRLERAVPFLVAVAVLVRPLALALVDPTPSLFDCQGCPESALVIDELPGVSRAIDVAGLLWDLSLMVLVGGLLVRRWRRASPALRRSLMPVFASGGAAIAALFAVNVGWAFSKEAGDALVPVWYVFLGLVPVAFLAGILRTRLARTSVGEVMLALQQGTPLRDALADALGDPTLEVSYRLSGSSRWIDARGHPRPEPGPAPGRAHTIIERSGLPIAALDYDAHLAEERELVDTVAAAAGLSLQNERLTAQALAQYAFLETITDTAPSLLVNVGTDGRILNQNRAAVDVAGVDDQEIVRGRFFWDVFIDPSERDDVIRRFDELAPKFPSAEYENTFTNARGEERVVYWRTAPVRGADGSVLSIVAGGLDITERHRMAEEKEREREFLNAIANHAPSLLCLVDAHGLVADRATNIAFEQTLGYTPDETGGHVFWERYVAPEDAEAVRRLLERVSAGESIGENDHYWLTSSGRRLLIAWTCSPLPQIDERRLFLLSGVDVTERKRLEEEIRASRSRIVRAEDEARRKLERNLHDGAQQRLVALSVALRLVESKLQRDPEGASELLGGARGELANALEDLRELARGIHPAVLTDRGLRPALEALAARAPLLVEIETPQERLAPAVEAAAYYVVAESLTNVTKYGRASSASVVLTTTNGTLNVTVVDDGVGGADPERGSGLRGLADRVEALEGRFVVESPVGGGTTIRAEIPLHPSRPSPG